MKIMGNSLALSRRLLETELILTPLADQANQTSNLSNVGARNFDANMVVILAALLCALIGALGINSIVRCFLRCSHRFNIESPEQAAARLAGTGLKKRDLGQIPIGVYGGDLSIKGTECAICLGEFEDGDKVRMLPICKHGFHVRCIDAWLLSHSSCPNCRHSLLAQPNVLKEAAVVEPSPPPGAASSHQSSVVLVIQTSEC